MSDTKTTDHAASAAATTAIDEQALTAAATRERRLVWKIDLLLMPLLTITYGLQYYDKAVLGSASIFGIIKDLGLSTKLPSGATSTLRYSTAQAAFYFGYIFAVLPIALVLQRLPLARTLGIMIILWGLVTILTVVVTDFKGLVVQRVFLGIVESSVSPGFLLISATWYSKSEQTTRLGIWYSATGIFSVFSGAINYGLGSAGGSLAPWKTMFLFAGAVTMAWGVVVVLLLPESPARPGRFFNPDERRILLDRVRRNQTGLNRKPFQWWQVREALQDPAIYFYLLLGSSIYVVNGGVTAFGARIVSSFGYSSLQTLLLLTPGGAVTMVTIYFFGWAAGKWTNSRTYLLPLSCIPVVVGAVIIWQASWTHRAAPLIGYYLLASFGAPYVLLLSLSAANTAGGTKKSIAAGSCFLGYNVGNIVGPYLVFTPEKPIKYRSTWIAVIIVMVVASTLSLLLRVHLVRENRRRDMLALDAGQPTQTLAETKSVEHGDEEDDLNVLEFDKTDRSNALFRYSL